MKSTLNPKIGFIGIIFRVFVIIIILKEVIGVKANFIIPNLHPKEILLFEKIEFMLWVEGHSK